jgi:glutaredoxin
MNFLKKLFSSKSTKTEPREYILYYRELCHDCDKVKDYMSDNKIDFNYFDCENKATEPPIPIFATPALFKNEELLAYGTDVIAYFEKI